MGKMLGFMGWLIRSLRRGSDSDPIFVAFSLTPFLEEINSGSVTNLSGYPKVSKQLIAIRLNKIPKIVTKNNSSKWEAARQPFLD